jgi:hypothetical protein
VGQRMLPRLQQWLLKLGQKDGAANRDGLVELL